MSAPTDPASSPDPRLERILAELIEAAETGEPLDMEAWVERYPEFENELREFLAGRQQLRQAVQRVAEELSPLEMPPTVLTDARGERPASLRPGVPAADSTGSSPARVRYFGDYELLEEIARGGMGVVYKARQVNLKRTVALKMILIGQLANDDDVRRFHAEAQAAAKLEHPQIVPIYEIGQHEGQHYFSMQFIDGESLAHRVSRGVLPPLDASGIMLKVARAIAFAHVEGVVHRDLKPANILMDRAGEPHVTDFGLAMQLRESDADASELSRLTATGQVLGTPSYMAPEQAAGKNEEVGRLSDVYSLGAVLYCLLTGRPPFQAARPLDTLLQVIQSDPVSPRLLDPAVPRDLETIVLKCLEKEPGRRYAGAAELADDLQRFLNDEPIVARPAGPIERLARLARKHRQTLTRTAATAAISLLTVLGGWSSWQAYQESLRGSMELTTNGPQMVAEVIDADGRPVTPSIPVPTSEPVTLREGAYRVRLSAPGLLSDTWPLDVERGESRAFGVRFRSRLLWPPREMPADEYLETEIVNLVASSLRDRDSASRSDATAVTVDAHPSILQVREPTRKQYGGRSGISLRLIDGVTGRIAWDVTLDEASLPEGGHLKEWTSLLGATAPLDQDRRLVRPLADLDGDGIRDLMFVARTSPALVAFSGRNGKLLWWHRARPVLPGLPDNIDAASLKPTSPHVGTSSVVGHAALSDVDGDGTLDAVACFMTMGESFQAPGGIQIRVDGQGWIEAISGKDGSTLWQQKLDSTFEQFLRDGRAAHYHTTLRPVVIDRHESRRQAPPNGASGTHTGTPGEATETTKTKTPRAERAGEIVLIVDQTLFQFDLATGKPTLSRADLPMTPLVEPVVSDLNRDGEDELVLLFMDETSSDASSPDLTLSAITQSGRELWKKRFQSKSSENQLRRMSQALFRVEDLDHDGHSEVLLPVGQYSYRTSDRWSGFTVLNGETGETRWQKRVASYQYNEPPTIERFISGPDLDGDGAREVFATWITNDSETRQPMVIVAAMSGRDGSRLWNWQHDAGPSRITPDPSGPLQWWQPGPDGWPLLLVPMVHGPGGQAMTFVLSVSEGRLEHTLPEVFDPKVADFNGDDLLDLFYTVSPQGAPRMLVAAGTHAEPWKRLGQWHPIHDVDGDQIGDFIGSDGVQVRSGRDQRLLFRIQEPFRDLHSLPVLSPPLPWGDLNGDGTPDLIGLQTIQRRTSSGWSSHSTLAAVSGRDGQRLWRADNFELEGGSSSTSGENWSAEYPAFDWCDLDRDGRAEIAVAMHVPNKSHSLLLALVSGRDGSRLFEVPTLRGAFGATPNPYGREFADINGDGVGDLAVWTPQPGAGDSYDAPCDLQAFSGRDGKPLWSKPSLSSPQGGQPHWPRATVGDLDGDGQLEVVTAWLSGYEKNQRGYTVQLAAVDGRSGDIKWTHESSGSSSSVLPPLLVDFEGNGRRSVCFATFGRNGHQLAVLDHTGQHSSGSPFTLSKSWRPGGSRVWSKLPFSQTSDRKESLLLALDDKLGVSRGTDEFVWQWPMDLTPQREYSTGGTMLLDWPGSSRHVPHDERSGTRSQTLPEAPDASTTKAPHVEREGHMEQNDARILAVWSGQGVYGLDAATGAMRWRCRVPWSPGPGFSHGPIAKLMPSDDPSGAPRVLCHWKNYTGDNWHTLVRQASPVTADGRTASITPAQRRYVPLADEQPPRVKLPWVTSDSNPLHRFVVSIAIPAGLVTLMMLVVPFWLVRETLRRRSVLFSLLLAAYSALCVSSALFGFQQAATSCVAFGVVAGLILRGIRERRWRPVLLAAAYSGVLVLPLVALHLQASRHPLRQAHPWEGWWWLDELTGERLMLALVGLPGVVFWWHLARAWREDRRATMFRLGLAAMLASAVAAAVLLTLDGRSMSAVQRYSTAGWYTIFAWGGYAVGLLMLVGKLPRTSKNLWNVCWRRLSRHA